MIGLSSQNRRKSAASSPAEAYALARLLRQALQRDRLQLRRDRLVQLPQRHRLLEGDPPHDVRLVRAADGRLAGQQLVERRPEAVDVHPVVGQAVAGQRLLRGHVPQRAEQVAAHRQAGVGAEPGQAEVADVDLAGAVQEQVAGLHVAVDDAERVGVLQGVGGVGDQLGDRR